MAARARTVVLTALALALAPAAARPAAAVEVSAGWAFTHIGLDDNRGGPVLGVGWRSTIAPGLDLAYALEYVQKRGAQPTFFVTDANPFARADAEVTLHVAQPIVLLELTELSPSLPHPYAGLSIALKLKEQWGAFPGQPSSEWAYADIDYVAHAGLARRVGPVRLDFRYSHGLTRQLLVDPAAGAPVASARAARAVDPLPGVRTPVAGTRLWQLQLAASLAF